MSKLIFKIAFPQNKFVPIDFRTYTQFKTAPFENDAEKARNCLHLFIYQAMASQTATQHNGNIEFNSTLDILRLLISHLLKGPAGIRTQDLLFTRQAL